MEKFLYQEQMKRIKKSQSSSKNYEQNLQSQIEKYYENWKKAMGDLDNSLNIFDVVEWLKF